MAPIFKPDLINYNDLDSNINYTYSSNYIMKIEPLDRNNYNIDVVDSNNDKLLSFKDYWEPGSGVLIRKYKDLELKFKNNKLDHSNVKIKMGRLMEVPQELVFDNKIGTIELETYRSSEASGLMSVYACAYAVEGKTQTYWLGENNLLTGESLIIQMIWDIFNNRLTSNTFYAHNLGKFDGHFLIKTLLDAGFKVKASIKEDKTIISLRISTLLSAPKGGKKKKVTLTILDSILMLKGDLKSLGEDFGASILKTEFPHKFASLENLSYVGATPSIDNYKDITANDYKSLLRDDWSFRDESLKYLINDVESLREILIKFGTEVYNLYNIILLSIKLFRPWLFLYS